MVVPLKRTSSESCKAVAMADAVGPNCPTSLSIKGHRVVDSIHLPSSQLSLSKDKIRVLLLEGVNDSAVQMIETAGYSNVTRLPKALEGDALKEAIKGVHR